MLAIKQRTSKARPDHISEIISVVYRTEKSGCEVKLCWVAGHAGIQGNEAANSIAKSALNKEKIDVIIAVGRVEYRGKIKEVVEREWQDQWEKEEEEEGIISLFGLI